ncbi:MAG: DUF4157 domain-containing protein [Ferruginibacter sp.]
MHSGDYKIKENSFLARIAAKKLGKKNVAMVLGKTIHLWNSTAAAFLSNEKWVKHELCHVQQYKRYGFFNFLLRYVWESLRKGYYNNKYEVEARNAENE